MLWLILLLNISSHSLAQDSVYEPIVRKQHDKTRARWSVEDWWVIKKKSRAQDQWLSWNLKRKPFFELIVDVHGGGIGFKRDGTDPTEEDYVLAGGGVQLFLGPLGIGIGREQFKIKEKEQYSQRDEGTLFLRAIGSSTQTTHLTLLVGKQKYDHEEYGNHDHTFYGVLANIYLFRHMGFEGQLRKRLSTESDSHDLEGEDYHWGMFWELSILRLYVHYFQDFTRGTRQADDVKDNERMHGSVLGARLYF